MYFIILENKKLIDEEVLNEMSIIYAESFDIEIKNEEKMNEIKDFICTNIEKHISILSFVDNELTGFITGNKISKLNKDFEIDEEEKTDFENSYVIELLAVKESYQNKGIGTLLLSKFENLIKGNNILIECDNNKDSINKILLKSKYFILKQKNKNNGIYNLYMKFFDQKKYN